MIDTALVPRLEELKNDFQKSKPTSMLDAIMMSRESRALVEKNSFALLIAVIVDQSVKSEVAWNLPHSLLNRIGKDHFNPEWMMNHSERVRDAIAQKPALHRFPGKMAEYITSLSTIIVHEYQSPDRFLTNSLDYFVFVNNLKSVSGISDKKANFLFLILTLDFHFAFDHVDNSAVLFDAHLEKWLTQLLNKKVTKGEANEICNFVSPDNPALLCPYIWHLDRLSKA
ncbi:hypothetical protein ACFP7A_11560 [Sporolactobacillus kofuensis]|uniref:Uncharacterized protein n=1 Tax=Sporolactobacillus kofuensis TaxID=269672 RepID=A0ABW1WIJ5_9BACL|nr:hypothetical protein [Sporolactobacillus kofuensis]MCO7176539.1 hypothetical protein [Sporolactobacillus kofuensis]